MENGSYRHPSCRSIYSGMGFDRIDVFMTKCALTFMERIHTLDNDIVEKSHQYSESIDREMYQNENIELFTIYFATMWNTG